jgi:carbon storage regulator CsrA
MLVLTRRPEEQILLPTVPAVIKVISAQHGAVRLGIEAPEHVTILREELCPNKADLVRASTPQDTPAVSSPEAMRSRVHNLFLALTLLRGQLQDNSNPTVRDTLAAFEAELQALRSGLTSSRLDSASDLPEPEVVAKASA